jgi:hypothetical protein
VSGGGGWGAKRGLLSLDPETSYPLPGQDGIERFAQSLQNRQKGEPDTGIVTPGSYVQFYAAPTREYEKRAPSYNDRSDYLFATTASCGQVSDRPAFSTPGKPEGILHKDHFSAVTDYGLYLRSRSETGVGEGEKEIQLKIDVPFSVVSGFKEFNTEN